MIYVTGLAIALSSWTEKPTWKNFRRMALVSGIILMGMDYNDRRLAYASFNQCLIAMFLISPWSRVKRYVTRAGILLAPLFLVYVAVGWANPTGIFSPVNMFKSMIVGEHNDTGVDGLPRRGELQPHQHLAEEPAAGHGLWPRLRRGDEARATFRTSSRTTCTTPTTRCWACWPLAAWWASRGCGCSLR